MTACGMLFCNDRATPMCDSGLSHAASVLDGSGDTGESASHTHGVRTITAPKAFSMTSFSMLILAGRVMMHLLVSFLGLRIKERLERQLSSLIPLDCTRQGQTDTGVSARWLDNYALTRYENPSFFGVEDHALRA